MVAMSGGASNNDNDGGNQVQYLNKTQNARQERITTIHAITLIKEWISDRLKMLRQT